MLQNDAAGAAQAAAVAREVLSPPAKVHPLPLRRAQVRNLLCQAGIAKSIPSTVNREQPGRAIGTSKDSISGRTAGCRKVSSTPSLSTVESTTPRSTVHQHSTCLIRVTQEEEPNP